MSHNLVRLRIDLSYDGSNFHGWARQNHLRTVQGEIESGLMKVLHHQKNGSNLCANGDVSSEIDVWQPQLVVAGRTDTGVHAAHQVCHLDIPADILANCTQHLESSHTDALKYRMQHVLPRDIAIHRVEVAPTGFDARFSALERTYVYRVCDNPSLVDPRMSNFVLTVNNTLNIEAMNTAVESAIGLHDFGSFARANPGGTTIRKVKYAQWNRVDGFPILDDGAGHVINALDSGLVCFTIVADAFAHNMVRSLVNACLRVGLGKQDINWFKDKVNKPQREGSTGPVDACGLTLEHVSYPRNSQLAERAQAIKSKRTLKE